MSHKRVEVTVREHNRNTILLGHTLGTAKLPEGGQCTVLAIGNDVRFEFPGKVYEVNIADITNAAYDLWRQWKLCDPEG
jgi:Trk K+ transport system NAD-binding subunit